MGHVVLWGISLSLMRRIRGTEHRSGPTWTANPSRRWFTRLMNLFRPPRNFERFSSLDMKHCFHQFEIEEKARKLFTFRTSWGLFRYTRMVMGNSPASSECHRRAKTVLQGCEGVGQIKDDVLVFGPEG